MKTKWSTRWQKRALVLWVIPVKNWKGVLYGLSMMLGVRLLHSVSDKSSDARNFSVLVQNKNRIQARPWIIPPCRTDHLEVALGTDIQISTVQLEATQLAQSQSIGWSALGEVSKETFKDNPPGSKCQGLQRTEILLQMRWSVLNVIETMGRLSDLQAAFRRH